MEFTKTNMCFLGVPGKFIKSCIFGGFGSEFVLDIIGHCNMQQLDSVVICLVCYTNYLCLKDTNFWKNTRFRSEISGGNDHVQLLRLTKNCNLRSLVICRISNGLPGGHPHGPSILMTQAPFQHSLVAGGMAGASEVGRTRDHGTRLSKKTVRFGTLKKQGFIMFIHTFLFHKPYG